MRTLRSTAAVALLALLIAVPGVAAPRRAQRAAQPTTPPAPAPAAQQPQPAQQPPQPQQQTLPIDQPISPAQIQKWFEAFTVLQAQDRLQLSETQYFKFVQRLKALQDTRWAHQQAHQRMLNDLRKLTNPQTGSNDEGAIAERLKALKDEDAAAVVDVNKAYDGVDETLDMRQQALFRIFEDQVEQQKLELLIRARQNARAQARGRQGK
jgi:hypothetical protein